MARILLTYELGGGLGHISPLLEVASTLRSHELTFALPDTTLKRHVHQSLGAGVPVVDGVRWSPVVPGAEARPTFTLADVLVLFGFNFAPILQTRVRHWEKLIGENKPDLIIADFAPALRLASCGRVPLLVMGTGFSVPPAGQALPSMRPWQPQVPDSSRRNERQLNQTVERVTTSLALTRVGAISDLFHGDSTFVCSLPQLDPYRSERRNEIHVPPPGLQTIAPGRALAQRPSRLFVYLHGSDKRALPLLESIDDLGLAAEAFLSERNPGAEKKGFRHIKILETPAQYRETLPYVKLVVHHGGLGTAHACLAAGTPQIIVPHHLEHVINGRAIQDLRCGNWIPMKEAVTPSIVETLISGLWQSRETEKALSLHANDLFHRGNNTPNTIAAACNDMLLNTIHAVVGRPAS